MDNNIAAGQLAQANCGNLQQGLGGIYYGNYPPPIASSFAEAVRVAKERIVHIERELAGVESLRKELAKLQRLVQAAAQAEAEEK